MKKLICSIILFLCILLSGCGNSVNVEYSEKLAYLPILPNSTFVDYKTENGSNEITYTVNDLTTEKALSEYKSIFEADGWTFDESSSTESVIKYTKDNHFAVVVFAEINSNVQYIIVTK